MTESEKIKLWDGLRRAFQPFLRGKANDCASRIAEHARDLEGLVLLTMIADALAYDCLSDNTHSALCHTALRAVESIRRGAISICLSCGGETEYLRPHVCAECHCRACVDLLQAARGEA